MNIRQIAKKAGVSVATVSRVLNHPESVAEKTKKHIEAIIAEEGYTPNWFARGLNLNRTGTIGLMIPHILNYVHMKTAKGVEDVAHQKGYVTFMCNVEEDADKEKKYMQQLVRRRVDGIILISSSMDQVFMKDIASHNIPMVLVGGSRSNPGLSVVKVNCKLGASQAVDHLISVGYRKIAILCGSNTGTENPEKLQGYKDRLEASGIEVNEEYILQVENSIEGGYLGGRRLWELDDPPEAMFTTSDQIALGAIDAMRDVGARIPEDIALVGFDNIRIANIVEPKLTTIDVPLHKMGVYGARLLFDIIEDGAGEVNREIILQTKLKIRKSCGHRERIGEMF